MLWRAKARRFTGKCERLHANSPLLDLPITGAAAARAVTHPYLVGYPYRLRELRRALEHINKSSKQLWLTTSGAIADYIVKLPPGIVPGDT
jgi:hypothetical protein